MSGPTDERPADDLGQKVDEATRAIELADPDADAAPIDRWINRVAEVIGVSVIATIVLLVFANAIGRYAVATPIIWAEELVIALIPWLAMSGVFLSVRRRQVIKLDYFTMRLPRRLRSAVSVFTAVLSAAAFTYLAFYSFQYLSLFGRDTTVYLHLPTGWFKSAMLIGSVAAALAFLAGVIRDRGRDA